jgi:hypothetical protein
MAVNFSFETKQVDSVTECGREMLPWNISSGGGLSLFFDELAAFDFSLVGDDSIVVSCSLSLEISSTVGESKLKDLAAERRWVGNGLDLDLCFPTCRPSLGSKILLLSAVSIGRLMPIKYSYQRLGAFSVGNLLTSHWSGGWASIQ